MQLTRRKFAEVISIGLMARLAFTTFALGTSAMLGGCNAVTDLENWIPVALTSVAAIVKLLGPLVPAPVSAIIVLIQAGFSALLTALQNYKAGTGVLSDITNAITAVESAFSSFFQALSVPQGLLNIIEGLAGILLSTISAFANEINPSSTKVSASLMGSQIAYTPKKRSVSAFKKDWNAECVAGGHPEARI